MIRVIRQSLLYRAIAAVAAFFSRQWEGSGLLHRFLDGARAPGGVFGGLWDRITLLLRRGFKALRLDRLLAGSIFLRPEFWCALTLALAPLVPTMAAAGLAGVSFFSIFLTHGAQDRKR
ncbi:MAG: hypothetical protein GX823_04400, partial [Clostridiales bacterium]|nr:hypothetical protein [Clostridiales bacterium]